MGSDRVNIKSEIGQFQSTEILLKIFEEIQAETSKKTQNLMFFRKRNVLNDDPFDISLRKNEI